LKFGQFSLDIRLLYLLYPADIIDILLISGVHVSSKVLPLGEDRMIIRVALNFFSECLGLELNNSGNAVPVLGEGKILGLGYTLT